MRTSILALIVAPVAVLGQAPVYGQCKYCPEMALDEMFILTWASK